jgi:membrane peptidoglycan carboxypeptidase
MRLAIWLERRMRMEFGSKLAAKREILARYASFVYMGHGQYGFAKASDYYFDRPLASLTIEDADKAAILAGIMKAPRDYAPEGRGSEAVLRRRNEILGLMANRGFITRDQLARCRQKPVAGVMSRPPQPINSAAVVQHILDEFQASNPDLDIEDLMQGRIHVYTTVDGRIQQIASDALERGLAAYEKRHPKARGTIQGAIVVLKNSDGSILAEIGGRQVFLGKPANYLDFNRVTESLRQPGSAMKPIVYLAAFRRGDFTLETMVPDGPISVPSASGEKAISNYDGQFKGTIPLRKAFAESRNTVAVWMASQVGIDSVLSTARSLGVRTPLKPYPATALGASEMHLLELATVYRTIASGLLVQPRVIRQVIDRAGDTIGGYYRSSSAERVVVNDAALLMLQEGLRGVVRMPTGTGHALSMSKSFPLAVMGKTGTTSEFRDAVFVGSTYGVGGITVAVRVGFDDNRTLGSRETGGKVALPIFQEVMRKVYGGGLAGPAPPFPEHMEDSITDHLRASAVLAMLPKPAFWLNIR